MAEAPFCTTSLSTCDPPLMQRHADLLLTTCTTATWLRGSIQMNCRDMSTYFLLTLKRWECYSRSSIHTKRGRDSIFFRILLKPKFQSTSEINAIFKNSTYLLWNFQNIDFQLENFLSNYKSAGKDDRFEEVMKPFLADAKKEQATIEMVSKM